MGNLRTAILAWAAARLSGRRFVMRIEDIDRERAGSAQRQLDDLEAIGVDWDGEPLVQSQRAHAHRAALEELASRGLVFECYCSRRDIREAASAPHVPPGHYPGTCARLSGAERASRREALAALGRAPALRLAAPRAQWTVADALHGQYTGPVDQFVVRRADGVPAYNLASVVDDAFQGVDQVVRGDDLLAQAPGQAQLASLLGLAQPVYAHVPLAVSESGPRLAKRDGAVTLADLADLGWGPADAVGLIGESLGVRGARRAADIADALGDRGLEGIPAHPWVVVPPTGRRPH